MKQEIETLERFNIAEDFWMHKLEDIAFNPLLSYKKIQENVTAKTFEQWNASFPPGLVKSIGSITGDSAAKAFLVFIAALRLLAHKYTGLNDILVTTSNIQEDTLKDSTDKDVLLFFRTSMNSDDSIRDILNNLFAELNTVYENKLYEYDSFLNRFDLQQVGEKDALEALGLVYNDFNKIDNQLINNIDILFKIERNNGGYALILRYDKRYFAEEQIDRLGFHFINCLSSMLENLDKQVQQVEILSEMDIKKLLVDFCGEKVEYSPQEKTFIPYFEDQIERSPHSTAIVCETKRLNYRQLNDRADQLAGILLNEFSLQQDNLVGILMERSEKMVESIIATWKCGAAYVPIDPDFPDDRIKTIIEDSRAKVLITDSLTIDPALADSLKALSGVLYLDKLENTPFQQDKSTHPVIARPNNLSYVIYTSGSTGKPKGVMVEHLGMMNHLHAKTAEIQVNAESVIAQNASQCFDISVWQFFAALLEGGQTIIYKNQLVLSPGDFIKQADNDGVTILEVVPSYLSMIMEIIDEKKLNYLFSRLKYLLVTGETVRPSLVNQWFKKFPHIPMVNAYGPTEASDDITHYIMKNPPENDSIPIGHTLRNFKIYIVDKEMRLCPIGVKGEICVSGTGVGRGYLNDTMKTMNAFIEDPFIGKPRVRMYRTGDIGRYLPNGNIEFFGRKDYQVKIRGYRIELEEIENKLSSIEGIKDAIVIDKVDQTNNKYLCAYITFTEGMRKEGEEIKRQLRAVLPEYMIPANIVILEAFPLTPNGKVDRKALPEPDAATQSSIKYIAPRNAIEKKLVEIWTEVLGIGKIGIHDNFFNIGGDSFKGIRIVNKLQEWLEEVVHVTVLFLAPTIEELAIKLENYKNADQHTKVDAKKIEKMRRLIQTLPPLPPDKKPKKKNPPAVFILCPSRSGSTLLRVILTGHPRLFSPQEFELLTFNTLSERKEWLSGKFSFYKEGVIRAIMEIKQCDADEAKNIMENFENQDMTTWEFYGKLQEWLGNKMLIEKTPAYTLDLETLKRAEEYFESTLYIHLIRNPYAVIYSFEKAKLDQIFKFDHDFPARELAEMAWYISHTNILEFLKDIPNNRKHIVRYEELVNDPAAIVSGICQFLGVEYNPEMIQVYKNPSERMTDGIYKESKMLGDVKFFTHSSINNSSVEKWKKEYKTEFLGAEATQLARQLGYLTEKISLDYSKLETAPVAESYELSHTQKRLWILNQLDKKSTAYNVVNSLLVEGNLDLSVLEKVFETLVRRHESLRTIFLIIDGEPRQKILEFMDSGFKLDYIDLRNEKENELLGKNILIKESTSPFDLEKTPPFKVKLLQLQDSKYVFFIGMHHIISDGWSMQLLITEILTLYGAFRNNTPDPLPPLKYQYKDYSVWQKSLFMQETLERQEAFWIKEFEGEVPVLKLPTDFPRPLVQSFAGKIATFSITPEETAVLNKLANLHGASLFMVLMAVFKTSLAIICNQDDIVIGTPIAGRNHPDLEYIVGMFVNTLAIRTCPTGEKTFTTYLNEVKEKTLKVFENQDYQFENLVDKLSLRRDMSRNPLFDVMFTVQSKLETSPATSQKGNTPLNIKPYTQEHVIAKFDLSLSSIEEKDGIVFLLEYCTRLFQEETIQRLISYIKNIISIITGNPNSHISKIEIIQEDEKKQLLFDLNNTTTDYPGDTTIQQLFTRQAEQIPDQVALVDLGPQTGQITESSISHFPIQISYSELNNKSDYLAEVLKGKGVQEHKIVALMAERSIMMIVSLLGILKVGGTYLPIDPEYPEERINYMLSDSSAEFILKSSSSQAEIQITRRTAPVHDRNSRNHHPGITESETETLMFENYPGNEYPTVPQGKLTSSNLAYIIYTSGSTGKPKGVLVEHKNVIRLVKETNYVQWDAVTKMLLTGSISFDISTFEIWGPLLNGLTLYMVKQDVILDGKLLEKTLQKNSIDILHLIPQLFNQLADQNPGMFAGLGYFLVGGDLVRPYYLNKIRNTYKNLNILHMYGPTENTVFSTFHPVETEYENTIPIGKPINNSQVYIIDKYDKLVPTGIAGELLVGGDGVARGYLNNPELTAAKFGRVGVNDLSFRLSPSNRPGNSKETRYYKTGDLARWQPARLIEFLGRIDNQIKIRGIRIELGEIENQLLTHKDIKEVVVIDQKNQTEEKFLCAYFVADREISTSEIREYLAVKLPEPMIPAYFIQMEQLPLTSTHKINRHLLPLPGDRPQVSTTYVAPQDNLEKTIAKIWEEVLAMEKVGVYDNFFDLGGNSLSIIKANNKLKTELQKEIAVADMFRYPTVESLANHIKQEDKDIFKDKEIKEAATMMEETMQLLLGEDDE